MFAGAFGFPGPHCRSLALQNWPSNDAWNWPLELQDSQPHTRLLKSVALMLIPLFFSEYCQLPWI